MTPLYMLRGIRRLYGARVALDLPFLDIEAGSIIGVSGPNGSGKSTLLRILAMLDAPDEGEMQFDGEPVGEPQLSMRRHVSLLLQEPYLLSMTVGENVACGLRFRGQRETEQAVRDALAAVGLDPAVFMGRMRNELSGGEAQRVALAARLAIRPRVLLMDEPTASVDEESACLIRDAALAIREQGTTVVIVSHDADWLASLADTTVRLRGGKLAGGVECPKAF